MLRVLSTAAGRFSGEEGLTGNLFSGEDNFRGLLIISGIFCGDAELDVGDVRLLNIFNGDVCSRSMGLFDESCLASLLGGRFSGSFSSDTLATNGELGMSWLSLSVARDVYVVTSYSLSNCFDGDALSAASEALDNGRAIEMIVNLCVQFSNALSRFNAMSRSLSSSRRFFC